MNDQANKPGSGETQTTRRLKYGLNVTVAVLAAVALAVLLNWIAYRQYIRFDWTATRQYSLSQQTQRVLERLDEDYRVVSMFRVRGPRLEQVRDLIEEYGRYSPHVDVQHIDPDRGVARREAFYQQLRQRHEDELTPAVDAIEAGREALRTASTQLGELVVPLDQALEHPQLADGQAKQFIGSVRAALSSTQSQLDQRQDDFDVAMQQALPDYGGIRSEAQRLLQELDESLLAVAVQRFESLADDATIAANVQDRLLAVNDRIKTIRQPIRQALDSLRNVPATEQYDQLVTELANREAVVVLSPTQVRVINVVDMFREPDPAIVEQTGQSEPQFLGEERLTGALVSMSVEQPALVVFVRGGQTPALGQRGEYRLVAERLRAANFRVEEWNPGGQMSAMGQQMPPQPPPQADDGQQTIWVILPTPPSSNPQAMMMISSIKQQVAEVLDRMQPQDAAMVMLSLDPGTSFGAETPILDWVRQWGIEPQLDRIVLQQVQLPNRQTQASAQFQVNQWPDALPITKALTGMPAIFLQGCPLVETDTEGIELHPLVQLRGQQIWAEDDMASLQSPQAAEFDPAASAETFTIGMAAQQGDERLVVVADPAWASDAITSYGAMGPGTAEIFGAAFPGNSELFVNSVYWLAGLDELIAASPRSQDIRRIEPLTPAAIYTYRTILLAGLPLAIVALGLGVWLVRRRD